VSYLATAVDIYLLVERGIIAVAHRLEGSLGHSAISALPHVGGLAIVYQRQSQYEEAERLFGRALKGREERLGRDHPDTLRTVHNLANAYE
jgi:hypothetical protein